ncbi:HAD family hydrolase [Colwellia sp. M166]|uniref:HAD family hydrolase n=1 Tax=Colwellia sp. M166 TaxID=2583805 RepID=UPI00211E6E69|nr:HAD family hydrolase [Colwellia sp. M166]UUO25353.1 HAD family hydrolase [Colwellia sp. M166]|tara:strand:- start:59417 stop:60127 length:711 start_codon:yes stop_codon:yes gene_type:complete
MTKAKGLSKHNAINLVIFDCDGVLVDSEILSQRVLLSMLEEIGVVVSEEYFLSNFLGFNFEHVTAKVFADFAITLTSEFRQRYRGELITVFAAELQKTQQLDWLLSELNVTSCVATSGSPEKVKHSLHYTKLEQYFNGRVFTSSEVKHGKPAPDLFLHAAKKMGVAPQNCLVLEDSNAGIRAGLAANMHVIRYVGASHLKNRDIATQILDDVSTIEHWKQLFEQVPSLSSSVKIER